MINTSAYYFSPSAIAITLNVSAGFLVSETVQVSVAAAAAVKIANQLTTQSGKVLNLGYTAALEYRTFRLSGVNTVLGYTPPDTYHYRNVKIYAYLRLDASNNGATGDVVFLPYEVDYDGRILGGGTPAAYPDITIVNDTDGYALSNTNTGNNSGLTYYYIHFATIDKPEDGARTWEVNLQTGQLETAKGNNEKGDNAWEKMFRLVNNLIQPQKAFEKIYFQSGVTSDAISIYIDRVYDTVTDSLEGFALWSHSHAVATTQSIVSYVKATVESLKGMFLRKDRDDETEHKLKMGEAEIVTNLSVGGDADIEGDMAVVGKMTATSAEIEEDLSVGGDVEIEGSVAVGDVVKTNKIVPRTDDIVEIGSGSDKAKVNGSLEVAGSSEFQGVTQHRDGLQVGIYTGNGILGTGAEIDKKGNTIVESLTARSFFSAPEYRFNRVTVTDGESWSTNGLGTIESVTQITSTTGYITLHLNEGEYGSVMEGDICRGIYNKMAAGVVEGGVLPEEDGTFDDCGFMRRYGFFTSYFWVKAIVTNEEGKCTFLYELRNASTPHPCIFMRFAQYGSFTKEERQSSSYENTHPAWYRVVYLGVNDWQIQPENISQLQGWLKGFTIRLRNGQLFTFQDRGLYIDKNIYFGESITELDSATIEDLRDQLALYDVELDIVADTITIDPTGNVLGGLWTEEKSDGQIYKKYRLHTAVTVKKGDKYLLLADDDKDADEGEYKIYVASSDCDYFVDNGTVYITRIKNIKDQIAGSGDDVNFDYDAMREMKEVKVTIIVDCEGKGSINRTFCVTVNHVDTTFISAHLDNQVANVSWNTKTSKYIGLPYIFNINAWHNAEELNMKSLVISGIDESHYTKEEDGKGGYTGKVTINSLPEEFAEVTNVNVTFTVEYAGVIYERTLIHTINRTQDTNVYELVPSPSSINAWYDDDTMDFSSGVLSCQIRCSSNESEPYMLTPQQMKQRGLSVTVRRKNNGNLGDAEEYIVGNTLTVKKDDEQFTFHLLSDGENIDEQDVPVVYDGEDGKDGKDAILHELRSSHHTIVKQKNGALNPSTITISAFIKQGMEQKSYTGFVVVMDAQDKLLLANYVASHTLSLSNASFPITARLWESEGASNGTPLAEASVVLVSDGEDGKPGDQGNPGPVGQTLRLRGLWQPNTRYENSEAFKDVGLHSENGVLYRFFKCEKTHTSGEIFKMTDGGDKLWDTFNQFDNVATSVLLANQGFIEVLGAGRLWIGKNEYGEGVEGWLITEGEIKHTKTGLTLTADGRLYDPDGLHLDVGLESVGIDLLNKIIVIRSNNFKVQNTYGDDTFYVDKHGNVTLAGYLSEKITYISNLDDWLSIFFPVYNVLSFQGKAQEELVIIYGNNEGIYVKGYSMVSNNEYLYMSGFNFDLTSIIGKHWGWSYANYGMLDLHKCSGVIKIDFQPKKQGGELVEAVVFLPWIHFDTADACTQVSLSAEKAMAVRLAPYYGSDVYKGSKLFTNGDQNVRYYPPYTTSLRHGAPNIGVVQAANILPAGYALYFNIELLNEVNLGIMHSAADLVFVNNTDANITLDSARIYYYYATSDGKQTAETACTSSAVHIDLSQENIKLYAYILINDTYKTNDVLLAEYNGYGMQFLRTITTYGNQPKHLITYEEMLGMLGKKFVMHNNTETDMYVFYDTQDVDMTTRYCRGYILLPPASSMGFTMVQESTFSGEIIERGGTKKELWLPKFFFKPDNTDRVVIDFARTAFNSANFGEQVYFEDDD